MWAGFEWENKVTVHTNIGDLRDYLHHLVNVRIYTFWSTFFKTFLNNLVDKYEMFNAGKNAHG